MAVRETGHQPSCGMSSWLDCDSTTKTRDHCSPSKRGHFVNKLNSATAISAKTKIILNYLPFAMGRKADEPVKSKFAGLVGGRQHFGQAARWYICHFCVCYASAIQEPPKN